MKFIKLFDSFSLNEKLVGNKYYLFTRDAIEDIKADKKLFYKYVRHYLSVKGLENISLLGREAYTSYKLTLTKASLRDENNYIYQVSKNLRLFHKDEYHISYALKNNILNVDKIKHWISYKDGDIIEEILISNIVDNENFFKFVNIEIFKEFYDGIELENGHVYVLWDCIKDNLELVDGNVKRFYHAGDTNIDFPDWVLSELHRYTDRAGSKMSPNVKHWLKENFKLPYTTKTLYRGMSIQLDDWGKYNGSIEEYNKKINRYIHIGMEDIGIGQEVVLKRGKESSWSMTPQISRGFTHGFASASINLLFKADVPAESVLIDFTVLPYEIKKKFRFHSQNEVIVDSKQVDAVINDVWYDGRFISYLEENGYTIKGKKIIKL